MQRITWVVLEGVNKGLHASQSVRCSYRSVDTCAVLAAVFSACIIVIAHNVLEGAHFIDTLWCLTGVLIVERAVMVKVALW